MKLINKLFRKGGVACLYEWKERKTHISYVFKKGREHFDLISLYFEMSQIRCNSLSICKIAVMFFFTIEETIGAATNNYFHYQLIRLVA